MTPILQKLDREWPQLATSPEARRALIRWANDHDELTGFTDLRDVLESRHNPDRCYDVLHALARLAATDELAARTILQMLLPGIVRLVATAGRGDRDAAGELIAIAWERIRTYPTTRTGSVAANVVLDARKRYLKTRGDTHTVPMFGCHDLLDEASSPEDQAIAVLQVQEICDARNRGILNPASLEVIVRTRFVGETLAEVASDHGVTTEIACQRRWRAERRIRSLPLAG